MNFEDARFKMVEQQIRPWKVLDPQALAVLSAVPRELFTPPQYQFMAYVDEEIPLPGGHVMLPPRIDARLMHDLALKGTETVLDIGTGSGYRAALLAHRSREVVSLEMDAVMAEAARRHLQAAGVHNVRVVHGDGSTAPVPGAPFDAIVLGGSVAEVPQSLLDQLKVGGRLLAIVGTDPVMQATLFTRTGERQFSSTTLWDTSVPALQNFAQPSRFHF
ncbi:MAG: protein-L-isoaspartate O-methyltransferase [Burkholderiaceae bacterium]|jgi:protein-L-isoaspartate(D-aspartate) O-methyltransferase|nr:protein-L-isoaspartate O-methyltransferase [Burkholderiaceae bacterium]